MLSAETIDLKAREGQVTFACHNLPEQSRQLMSYDPVSGEISFNYDGSNPLLVRSFIQNLTADLRSLPGAIHDLPIKHTFLNGVYVRELFIPKGTLLTGKVHRLDCINIVSKGDISILTEFGSGRMTAGQSAISHAGTQKLGFANADTVFINIFRTDVTEISQIEDEVSLDANDAIDSLTSSVASLFQKGD